MCPCHKVLTMYYRASTKILHDNPEKNTMFKALINNDPFYNRLTTFIVI